MKETLILTFVAAGGGLVALLVGALLLDLASRVWTWLVAGCRADERQRSLRALKRINGQDMKDLGRRT